MFWVAKEPLRVTHLLAYYSLTEHLRLFCTHLLHTLLNFPLPLNIRVILSYTNTFRINAFGRLLVHRWNVGDFLFYTGLFVVFLPVFNYVFLSYENFHSKIIGYVDITLTMCFAHSICFYGFKQDQLRSTIFDSITNHIFSVLKAIYSFVFPFVSHHFWKIYKKLNSETLTCSSH